MKNQNGLTLPELMVVLAVVAIIAAVGLPQLQGVSDSNRMSSTINALAHDLSLARSEAIKRNLQVDITARPGARPGWANGWTVSINAGATILKTAEPIPTVMTLDAADTVPNPVFTVSYGSDGTNVAATNIQFSLCNPNIKRRFIQLGTAGRHSTYTDTSPTLPTTCP